MAISALAFKLIKRIIPTFRASGFFKYYGKQEDAYDFN